MPLSRSGAALAVNLQMMLPWHFVTSTAKEHGNASWVCLFPLERLLFNQALQMPDFYENSDAAAYCQAELSNLLQLPALFRPPLPGGKSRIGWFPVWQNSPFYCTTLAHIQSNLRVNSMLAPISGSRFGLADLRVNKHQSYCCNSGLITAAPPLPLSPLSPKSRDSSLKQISRYKRQCSRQQRGSSPGSQLECFSGQDDADRPEDCCTANSLLCSHHSRARLSLPWHCPSLPCWSRSRILQAAGQHLSLSSPLLWSLLYLKYRCFKYRSIFASYLGNIWWTGSAIILQFNFCGDLWLGKGSINDTM